MKVPELNKYSQVQGISVANKRCEELWDLFEAHELAIKIVDEQGDQMGILAKLLLTDDETIPDHCDYKKWVHKTLKFHSFRRDDKIKRKWMSAISLRTKDYKWNASHRVCSAHFHGGHLYGSNNIPAIFPRRDLKTGKVVRPIDISHLLVEKNIGGRSEK